MILLDTGDGDKFIPEYICSRLDGMCFLTVVLRDDAAGHGVWSSDRRPVQSTPAWKVDWNVQALEKETLVLRRWW